MARISLGHSTRPLADGVLRPMTVPAPCSSRSLVARASRRITMGLLALAVGCGATAPEVEDAPRRPPEASTAPARSVSLAHDAKDAATPVHRDDRVARADSSAPSWANVVPGSAAATVRRFGGAWDHAHTIPMWTSDPGGGRWKAAATSSCLSVTFAADGGAVLELATSSTNGHSCALSGAAGLNEQGDLVTTFDIVQYDREGMPSVRCWMRIEAVQGGLHVAEAWPAECERPADLCGARGTMVGHRWDATDRGPARLCLDAYRNL